MKSKFLLLLIMCVLWDAAAAHDIDTKTTNITVGETTVKTLSLIIGRGLPVIYVETVDAEEPTCEYVSAPPGCMGATIRNATKVPGRLVYYQRIAGIDSVLYDSGDYEEDVSGMTIKLRGNTSAYDVKKPYKIKLQKKKDLLFRDNESVYKDKEWLLLRDDYLTTIAGLKVNELLGMTWTPQHHFVNLIMNGDYRGTYLLCESVKRNPDCRLNVDKNSGFIFECDPYWWNEAVYVSSNKSPSYNYTFKYPDDEDITEEQLAYMQTLVRDYENSLNKSTYPDKIDVASFAAWCLVHDVMGTKDAGGANRYYLKYDTTAATKIVMPLAWDFDMAERMTSAWSQCHTTHMTILFNNTTRDFVGEFADLWRKVRGTLVNDMTQFMTDFRNSSEGVTLENCLELDRMVYGRNITVYGQSFGRCTWITNRFPWLDNAINNLNPLGDVNVDGKVDITDVTMMIDAVLNGTTGRLHAADINTDDNVNITDVTELIRMVLKL